MLSACCIHFGLILLLICVKQRLELLFPSPSHISMPFSFSLPLYFLFSLYFCVCSPSPSTFNQCTRFFYSKDLFNDKESSWEFQLWLSDNWQKFYYHLDDCSWWRKDSSIKGVNKQNSKWFHGWDSMEILLIRAASASMVSFCFFHQLLWDLFLSFVSFFALHCNT